jgi:hypothetical protein
MGGDKRGIRRDLLASKEFRFGLTESLGISDTRAVDVMDRLLAVDQIFPCQLDSNVRALGADGALVLAAIGSPEGDTRYLARYAMMTASMQLQSTIGDGPAASETTANRRSVSFGTDLADVLIQVWKIAFFARGEIDPFDVKATIGISTAKGGTLLGTLEARDVSHTRIYASRPLDADEISVSTGELALPAVERHEFTPGQLVAFAAVLDRLTDGSAVGIGEV